MVGQGSGRVQYAARPPSATLPAQQARLEAWRQDFNTNRPHEALGQRCPALLGERANRLRRSGLARTVRPTTSSELGVAAART